MNALMDTPENADVCGGRIVLVMFPCNKMGYEVDDCSSRTAMDISFLRKSELERVTKGKFALTEVLIVLIDEVWPRARSIFAELVNEAFDSQSDSGENSKIKDLFDELEWKQVQDVANAPGKRFNPNFERNALVIKMEAEPPEKRLSYPQLTNFGREQGDDFGVCTLEAAVRLAEMIGQLSREERAAAQQALNEYLEGKEVGSEWKRRHCSAD